MPKNPSSERLVFAADLGGTHLRVALVDEVGTILQQLKQPTPTSDSPDAILDAHLAEDPEARVAADVIGGHGTVFITGEVTSRAKKT